MRVRLRQRLTVVTSSFRTTVLTLLIHLIYFQFFIHTYYCRDFRWSGIHSGSGGNGYKYGKAFDFNGDGTLEVFVRHNNVLNFHLGHEDRNAAVALPITGTSPPAFVDVDGDGKGLNISDIHASIYF